MTFSSLIAGVAIFTVVLAIIAVILLKMKKNKEDEATETIVKNYQETTNNTEALIEKNNSNLLHLNIFLRENVSSKNILNEFESVIDLVKEVFEPANDPKNYSEQTIIVNRMSTDYLPKVLEGYMLVKNQENSDIATIEMLQKIKTQLEAVKHSYETLNQEEFERNTRIMKSIFESYATQAKGE